MPAKNSATAQALIAALARDQLSVSLRRAALADLAEALDGRTQAQAAEYLGVSLRTLVRAIAARAALGSDRG